MANNEYVFILKNDTRSGKKSPVAGDNAPSDNAVAEASSGVKKDDNALTASLVAWQKVKPYVNRVVSHEINMVQIETGMTEYTQKLQFGQEIASSALGMVESAVTGFAVSGNWVGAVVGVATNLTNVLLNYMQKQTELNERARMEQGSLQLNNIRAGYSGSRRR